MDAAFISGERYCEQNEHHNEHDALFVFRKIKYSE